MLEVEREGLPYIICHNRHRPSMSSRQGPGHTKQRLVQKNTPPIHLSPISSKYHLSSLTVKELILQVPGKPSPVTKYGQIRPSFVKIKTPHKCGRLLNLYLHTYFFPWTHIFYCPHNMCTWRYNRHTLFHMANLNVCFPLRKNSSLLVFLDSENDWVHLLSWSVPKPGSHHWFFFSPLSSLKPNIPQI